MGCNMPIKARNINLGKNRKAHYNKNTKIPLWMEQLPTKDDLNFCCYRFNYRSCRCSYFIYMIRIS